MSRKQRLFFLLGPGLLLGHFLLLFVAVAPRFERPVWLFWLACSFALSIAITRLGFLELTSRWGKGEDAKEKSSKEVRDLRSLLDETQLIYKEKVERLEEEIATLEEEFKATQEDSEAFEKEAALQKGRSSDFQTALQDALEDLRKVRQESFLAHEGKKLVPRDLAEQHRQLRTQFDEKSLVLEQTRHRLFEIEGQLIASQLDRSNREDEEGPLLKWILEMEKESDLLREEISALEELVQALSEKKSSPSKKKLEEMRELTLF